MRSTFWLLILLAGTLGAEWRHFGDNTPVAPPASAAATTPVATQSAPLEASLFHTPTGYGSMPQEMVTAHNTVRARVGEAPLMWSDKLASVAQDWAEHLLTTGRFEHSHNPKYGENLYEITGAFASPAQVIHAFASEVKDYDYRTNNCHGVCGHYTQLVWNDTKEVGCAVARAGRKEVWVCEYDPPGNWVGRKPY